MLRFHFFPWRFLGFMRSARGEVVVLALATSLMGRVGGEWLFGFHHYFGFRLHRQVVCEERATRLPLSQDLRTEFVVLSRIPLPRAVHLCEPDIPEKIHRFFSGRK